MATSAEKRHVREAVKRALKTGALVKPDRCEGCDYEVAVQAHHPDYSRPLNVEWLCIDCHADRHDEADDMDATQFRWAFKWSEAVQARYEDQAAYTDWHNWPPN